MATPYIAQLHAEWSEGEDITPEQLQRFYEVGSELDVLENHNQEESHKDE